jgi:transcriptional regulator GlxA family with amidase domain
MTRHRRPVIALLVAPETSASVLYGLYDVLGTVGPMWPDMTAAEPGGHEEGQLPFSAMTRRVRTDDRAIRECLAWIADGYATPAPVGAMIERSGLTPRTFARRFRAATGRRPIEYVHELRIERARGLLEGGAETVDDVGHAVGYEDPTFFRRLFKRTTGMTPAAYRRRFAPIASLPAA